MNIFNKLKNYNRKSQNKIPAQIWHDPLFFIAFGFGVGAIPFAPGTFGTIAAIPIYLLLSYLPLTIYIIVICIFAIASMILCDVVSKKIHVHDHPGMCIDEFIGFFFTMIAAPSGWQWIFFGFLLFRFFDIVKPWPISFLDKNIPGGFGMILDDIVAGLFAMIIIQLTRNFF